MAPIEDVSLIDLPIDYFEDKTNRNSVSWLPPHAPNDGGGPPTDSVILDTLVYVDDRTNASTAEGFTSNGHAIYLTFWPASPPLLSYFTVHLPSLLLQGSATSLDLLPSLIATDGDLALLRVTIGPVHNNPKHINHIIYRAGINKLEVLPAHPTRAFCDMSVGLLSCPDSGRFFVANLRDTFSPRQYELDLFDSSSGTWSTRPIHPESPQRCHFCSPTKVITMGSSIGWVDIMNGILLCDLLHGGDVFRFIHLPLLPLPNKNFSGYSLCDRDVAITNDGCIKYVQVWARPVPGSHYGSTYISQDWGVAIARWVEPQDKWRIDCTLKASEVVLGKNHSKLLPGHVAKAPGKSPTLSRLHTGHPALSLHDDGIVYIMAKVDHRDYESWMLAVDTRNKTLKRVTGVNTSLRSSSFSSIYFQSDFSKHLPKSKKSEISEQLPKSKNRRKHNQKRDAAKTSKQGAVETLANSLRVDADVMLAGSKHFVNGSKVKEQEHEVKILDFIKAPISCS